jgi:transposase
VPGRPGPAVRLTADPIDATAIACAARREGIEALPVAFLDEQAHEIRVLDDYRDQFVNERARLASRLRWHLVQIAPELEAQIRPAGPTPERSRVWRPSDTLCLAHPMWGTVPSVLLPDWSGRCFLEGG